ncbi:MAG: PP2C family protein-serine/threonine phosphatase [Lachnospiraceae bacterium]|nr:PP2C family protein-serine/threonine phosphatase [Lachnospiraceae bacterium]
MSSSVILLWSVSAVISFVFSMIMADATLKAKYPKGKMIFWWIVGLISDFVLVFVSYTINPLVDVMNAIGQCIILVICLILLYSDSLENKAFIGMTMSLASSVAIFLFCGTTDQIVGARLNLFDEVFGPYTIKNILFFSGIKIIVLAIIAALYVCFLRKAFTDMLRLAEGQMKKYLVAPAFSVIGFYIINIVSNSTGIYPTNAYFVPLYLTVCTIFVVEYIQIFSSVRWTAEAKKAEQEKERIGAELNVATQIQADMLPRIFPAFPERNEFDLYALMNPAKEVGGDFYDFFLIDDDHIGLVMADVSGKGVPAALFMVIAKTLIKNRAQMGGSPSEVLAYANDQLGEGNEAELFVTVWFAIIEISTGKGVAANAGHEHPAICRKNGKFELVKYRHSPAVATIPGIEFREHEFKLEPGDSLYVYTDGVTEATRSDNVLFGTDRMLDALNKNPSASPEKMLKTVRADIDEFVGSAPQFDDITMLGFKYMGAGKE